MDKNRFRQRFIPTVFWYAAYSSNPWNIANQSAENALRCIWKALYKGTIGDMNAAVKAIVSWLSCSYFMTLIDSETGNPTIV